MGDIQYRSEEGLFNSRVVGVCIKNNKCFLSKLRTDDYWTYIGGKAAFGESTEEAIVREYKEEVGVTLQIDRLLAIVENFFHMDGNQWHQYLFFYLLEDKNGELDYFEGEREVLDNRDAIYKWVDLSELDHMILKPECSHMILKNLPINTIHIVNRDIE